MSKHLATAAQKICLLEMEKTSAHTSIESGQPSALNRWVAGLGGGGGSQERFDLGISSFFSRLPLYGIIMV